LAVFELVKNAYDADATSCTVTAHDIETPRITRIVVEDDGSGMTVDTVRNVWLEPGTEFRKAQRDEGKRSDKFKRLPLGEKGVGRFAAHKLGDVISMVTRSEGHDEVEVHIDWRRFSKDLYLDQVPVEVRTRKPIVFTELKTGTRIEISKVRQGEAWTRGRLRELHRSITSICSPFGGPASFQASLRVEPPNNWLDNLLDVSSVLEQSLFRASGVISGTELKYKYEFVPLPGMVGKIERRDAAKTIPLPGAAGNEKKIDLTPYSIGEVRFELRVFDRDPLVLELTSDKTALKKYLDVNGGLRVYRDGVRIFDFGEPGNDWLNLGGRRVNIPTGRISNNQIIGAVHLKADASSSLVEKTNREGFIENDAYEAFRHAVLFAVAQIEFERNDDKERVRSFYSRGVAKRPVLDEIAELRNEIESRKLGTDLISHVNRIEREFLSVEETLLTAATSGLTLTVIIHEVEKAIKELLAAVRSEAPIDRIRKLAEQLGRMIDGLTFLTRKSGTSVESASALIDQAVFNMEYRFRAHGIQVENGMKTKDPDFQVRCVRRLVVGTLMNLMDNSIYWLEAKGGQQKKIYVGSTLDLDRVKPALVVADNGPGFQDAPEHLVQPFVSRKPDGMGLGLHLANEVAKLHHGALLFPRREDLGLPVDYNGAIVALQFPEKV